MRDEFPALSQGFNGKELVYLDSAATSLKPFAVIEALNEFYKYQTANVHRGAHWMSDRATERYERSRQIVARHLGAYPNEIIFVGGTTDGINMLASCLGKNLEAGDEIVLSEMEHHSNLVPWQILAKEKGLSLKFIPVDEEGELQIEKLESLITSKTKILSLVHVSNALGTVNPIKKAIDICNENNVASIIDAAQSISCMEINVKDLNCDYLVFSGHKVFGPYGVGVVYGKEELLNKLPPYRGGGSMISNVELSESTYLDSPQRFEAGTPNISGVIGLGSAIEKLNSWGIQKINEKLDPLLKSLVEVIENFPGLQLVGSPKERKNVVSFTAEWAHPSDIGQILDQQAVAVRAGHHCTQPLMKKLGISGTIRASLAGYNNENDIDRFEKALKKAKEMLS